MKLTLSTVDGELKYNLSKEELLKMIIKETTKMQDDDILLVYTMCKGWSKLLGTNVLSIYLTDGYLEVFDEKTNVTHKLLYSELTVRNYYNLLVKLVDGVEEKYFNEESRAFEKEQYEQAEAEKCEALYSLSIGNNNFRFKGENAADCIYSVIQGLFSSLSRDEGVITIRELNKGEQHTIKYAKGLAKASVKIDGGQYNTFDYCYPAHNRELQNFIKGGVIL